jgi:hypothetical protein
MRAVGRALDKTFLQQPPAHPPIQGAQNKTTPRASATTGTRKKSIWRLIVGALLIGLASTRLSKPPDPLMSHDVRIWYFVWSILFAIIGVWLVVSYLRRGSKLSKRSKSTLLILSVGLLLFVAAMAYTIQKSAESNKQFGNAMRAFATDVQGYAKAGGTGNFPTFKPTGDADTDLFGRYMNDLFQSVASVFAGMNRELDALGEKDVFETSVLTSKPSLEAEARKRSESQRIIAKYRNDIPGTLDAFRQKVASSLTLLTNKRRAPSPVSKMSARKFPTNMTRCSTC